MSHNVREVLDGIVEKFKSGDIPKAVAFSVFPVPNIPSSTWSFRNRILMILAGTGDARGFRQWQEVGRSVKKGAKAFYIHIPLIRVRECDDDGTETILKGFRIMPVFRYEDTTGKPVEHPEMDLSSLPLLEKAEEWGISVRAIPGNYKCYGYYSSKAKVIGLATKEEQVFFHELAHVAHEKLKEGLKEGQDPLQEIVAELASQALCHLVGKRIGSTLGSSYQYIENYAAKLKISALRACLDVLDETEQVLNLILTEKSETSSEGRENIAL
ncbi:MAG TPA: ArdC family protein [Candidatus Deferrimicrobiaceae bacterium]|jgi:hypothetical protein